MVCQPQETDAAQLLDIASDLRSRSVWQQPERTQLVVPARHDLIGGLSAEHPCDVQRPESLTDARDAREDLAGNDHRIADSFELVAVSG